MDDAQHGVTGGNILDQHAKGTDIVKPFKSQVFFLHLFPDAENMLGPPAHLGLDAGLGHGLAQGRQHGFDISLAITPFFRHQGGNAVIGFRLQGPEDQIFQFPFDLSDTQAVGQRRMDIGTELRQADLVVSWQGLDGTHAHQLPRQQDQHHAQILHDRQQQAAQAFRTGPGPTLGMDRPDLFRLALTLDQFRARQFRGHFALRVQGKADGCAQGGGIGAKGFEHLQGMHQGAFLLRRQRVLGQQYRQRGRQSGLRPRRQGQPLGHGIDVVCPGFHVASSLQKTTPGKDPALWYLRVVRNPGGSALSGSCPVQGESHGDGAVSSVDRSRDELRWIRRRRRCRVEHAAGPVGPGHIAGIV